MTATTKISELEAFLAKKRAEGKTAAWRILGHNLRRLYDLQTPTAAEQRGVPGGLQVRLIDGELDEIVVSDCDVHLERMADDSWWMGITLADGQQTRLVVNLGAKRAPVTAWAEVDASPDPDWWASAVTDRITNPTRQERIMTASKDLSAAIERLRGYVDNGGLIHTASAYRTSDGRVHLIEFDDLRAVLDAASSAVPEPPTEDEREAVKSVLWEHLGPIEADADEMGAFADAIIAVVNRQRGPITEVQRDRVADFLWNEMVGTAKSTVRNVVAEAFQAAGITVEAAEALRANHTDGSKA